jgi:hypothetical protein
MESAVIAGEHAAETWTKSDRTPEEDRAADGVHDG